MCREEDKTRIPDKRLCGQGEWSREGSCPATSQTPWGTVAHATLGSRRFSFICTNLREFLFLSPESESEVAQSCPTLCDPRLLCPWDFLSKGTGVGCRFLLQGIFPPQELNPGLPHCRQMLYPLSHQGSLSPESWLNHLSAVMGIRDWEQHDSYLWLGLKGTPTPGFMMVCSGSASSWVPRGTVWSAPSISFLLALLET